MILGFARRVPTARPVAATAPVATGPAVDNSPLKRVAMWFFWVLTARLIIPGFFDYGPNVDLVEAAKREAVFNKVTWLLFLAAGAWLVLNRMNSALKILRATTPGFLILVVFATCSVAWSMNPAASLARLFHLGIVLLACLSVTMYGWHEKRFQQVVRPIITAFLIGSLIFGIAAPNLAIAPPTYPHLETYWGGLTIGKNALGAIASTGAILWMHGWATREVKFLPAAAGVLLSLLLIALARAATFMLATALSFAVLFLMLRSSRGLRRYMVYAVGMLVIVTVIYGLAVLHVVPGLDVVLAPVLALTGKDATFTNRALIWEITREHIHLSPILGTGYGGFWADVRPGTPAYDFFVPRMFFNPGECHDGYLEIINDMGYVGLLLLFGYLIGYLRAALRLLKTHYTQVALYLALLFQEILAGLSESNWLWLDAQMLIFTLATICLARHKLDAVPRQTARAAAPVADPWPARARVARG
jgi:exopolysaccharide production protein ExoQ